MSKISVAAVYASTLLLAAAGHGNLSRPRPRGRGYNGDPILLTEVSKQEEFVCRKLTPIAPGDQITVTAGTPVEFKELSSHISDCFVYMTYDVDAPDLSKRFFMIAEIYNCDSDNVDYDIKLPPYLPAGRAIIRSTWQGMHSGSNSGGLMELYTDCIDVKVRGPANGELPFPMFKIPGNSPARREDYRPYINPKTYYVTGPPLATVRGQCPPSPLYFAEPGAQPGKLLRWSEMDLLWNIPKSDFSGLQNVDPSLVLPNFDFSTINLNECASHNPPLAEQRKISPENRAMVQYNQLDHLSNDWSCRPFCCINSKEGESCDKVVAGQPVDFPGATNQPRPPVTTQAPPTQAPPTQAPPTQAPPTRDPRPPRDPPTQAPPTQAPPTRAPPTDAPSPIIDGSSDASPFITKPLSAVLVVAVAAVFCAL